MAAVQRLRARLILGAVSTAFVVACGGTLSDSRPQEEAVDVASIRLFDAKGPELTQHIPLVSGQSTRMVVRLYAADSREVTSVPGGVELALDFIPPSLASSAAVDGQPLVRDITPTTSAGSSGTLTVSLRLVANDLTRSFRGFEVLVHGSGTVP